MLTILLQNGLNKISPILLDREKVDQYLRNIASGFQKDPLEVILSLLFISLMLFLLFFSLNMYQRMMQQKREREGEAHFIHKLQSLPLSKEELGILKTMAEGVNKAFLPKLLCDYNTFMRHITPLIKKEKITYTGCALLRKQLGIKRKGVQYHSTAEFRPGMTLIIHSGNLRCHGIVESIESKRMLLRAEREIPVGATVNFSFYSSSGFYFFQAKITEKEEESFVMEHTEEIKRVQNRKFFRKRVTLPAELKAPAITDRCFTTTIMDLGGGGAKIKNPWREKAWPEEFILVLKLKNKMLSVKSRVVRISTNKSSLGIAFTDIKPADQDLIIRQVMG